MCLHFTRFFGSRTDSFTVIITQTKNDFVGKFTIITFVVAKSSNHDNNFNLPKNPNDYKYMLWINTKAACDSIGES